MSRSCQEIEKSIEKESLEAEIASQEAIQCGINSLEELQRQNEFLSGAGETLISHRNLIEKSNRVLRGMTFSGSLLNLLTSRPTYSTESQISNRSEQPITSENSIEKSEEQTNTNDPFLQRIAPSVNKLHQLSLSMREELINQNNNIYHLNDLTQQVDDETLAVTIKASKLARKSKSSKPIYIGKYQLLTELKLFLAVTEDGELILIENPSKATIFNLFMKEDNLFGIQSLLTLKFLGVTIFGSIRFKGEYFGSQEECFLNLNSQSTGILILAKGFGVGGWLQLPLSVDETLCSVTSGISDKDKMVMFRPVPVTAPSEDD